MSPTLLPGGGHIFQDELVSCNHYVGSDTPGDTADARAGWLILSPRRHVTRLFDLTEAEWAAITGLASRLDHAMTRRFNVGRTILASLGWYREDHIHFHVVPTAIGQLQEDGSLDYPEITNGWLNFGGTTESGTSLFVPVDMAAADIASLIREDLRQQNDLP